MASGSAQTQRWPPWSRRGCRKGPRECQAGPAELQGGLGHLLGSRAHGSQVVLFLAFCGGFWSCVCRTRGVGTRSPFCLHLLTQLCWTGQRGSPGALGKLIRASLGLLSRPPSMQPAPGPGSRDGRTDTSSPLPFPGWWDFQLKPTDQRFTKKHQDFTSQMARDPNCCFEAPFSAGGIIPSM